MMRPCTLLFAMILFSVATATHAAPLFSPRVDYRTDQFALDAKLGDLNRDGKLDVVTANGKSNTVSILLGNGDGSLRPQSEVVAAEGPQSVAIGDLNGDGIPDLAVANVVANTVSVLLGNGDGTFGPRTDFVTGSFPASVAIGELNGDGRLDLVVGNFQSNGVSVLLGNGDGTFLPKRDIGTGRGPWHIALGDLNGDGRQDLVLATPDNWNRVSVLLGNGNASFGIRSDYLPGSGPNAVAIGDLNRDGKADLATANSYDNTVGVLFGTGNGIFGPSPRLAGGNVPVFVAVGDLNGDRKLDLAVANPDPYTPSNASISVFLGDGNGGFGARTDYEAGQEPYSVAIGDMNNDGSPDLVAPNSYAGTVSVFLNTSGGPAPVEASLVSATTAAGTARLSWFIPYPYRFSDVTIYRRAPGEDWRTVALRSPGGGTLIEYEDSSLAPGVEYAYRIGIRDENGIESFFGEVTLRIEGRATLSLEPPSPNPSNRGLRVRFTLPNRAPARLELVDLSGRSVNSIDIGARGAGVHEEDLAAGGQIAPGIYVVRLTQGVETRVVRASVIR